MERLGTSKKLSLNSADQPFSENTVFIKQEYYDEDHDSSSIHSYVDVNIVEKEGISDNHTPGSDPLKNYVKIDPDVDLKDELENNLLRASNSVSYIDKIKNPKRVNQNKKNRSGRSSKKQLEIMVNYIQNNTEMIDVTKVNNKWGELTHILNGCGEKNKKTCEDWKKVFKELQKNVKRRARRLKAEQMTTGGGFSKIKPLSDVEDIVLTLVSKVGIEGSSKVGELEIEETEELTMTHVPFLNESDSHNEEPQKKRKRTLYKWKYDHTFTDEKKAQEFIKTEHCWSLKNTNQTEEGTIKYYRCNKVKSRGKQCQSGIKLIFDSSSTQVVLHRLKMNHNCNTITTKAGFGMLNEVKIEIEDLFKKKLKPRAILDYLSEKHVNPPNINQIKNYLAQLKKSNSGLLTISLVELEIWLNLHQTIPEDNDKPFVVNYLTDDNDDGHFRFMVSSKTLLKLALKENVVIHADATYKLIWQGFPVLLVGSTDHNRKFNLLGIAVCSNEQTEDFDFIFRSLKEAIQKNFNFQLNPKVLISDSSMSIRNGFKNVFGPEPVVRMCSAHMRRAVQKKVQTLVQKENINRILSDIDAMQISENENSFLIAYKLFLKKWADEIHFLKYFEEEWFNKNKNWYAGASLGTQSTNNALESLNRIIKDEYAFRERLPLSRFCHVLMEIVETFSNRYENNTLEFSDEVFIDLKTWTSAYQWVRLNKKIDSEDNALERIFLIPAGQYTEINKSNLGEGAEDNFDDYIKKKSSYYNLTLPLEEEKWKDGRCTCPKFLKNYICKHLLGVAMRFKYINPPVEAQNLVLGIKESERDRRKQKKH